LIAAAGVGIVLYQWASARPLWLDEEMIALNFRDRSFAALAGRLWLDQTAPLGWLALQRASLVVLGSSELALRAVPALFGALTILAALFIGQRWLTGAGSAVFLLLCSLGQWITFHAIELKSYSADTFWGIWLPALAVSAAVASSSDVRRRGLLLWAIAAAIGPWFSLGALLVLPACFAVLTISLGRHPETFRPLVTAFSLVIGSFALHYFLSIRPAQGNASLQEFWQFALPPRGAGVSGTIGWLFRQLEPFAMKPGGTAHAALFWSSAFLGVAFASASARLLGIAAGLVLLSGLALAGLRVMPIYERLSLWFLPALYLGIALFADRAVWFLQQKPLKRSWMNRAAAGLVFAMVAPVCIDIAHRGIRDLRVGRPRTSNRDTDDRAAVAWLMQERLPGDILITTRHALPAIWWYGGVPISEAGGRQFSDGGRILVAEHYTSHRVCRGRELDKAIDGRHRIQVYLGFVDTPPGFDDLLLERLSTFGTITALRHFDGASRAAVIDPAASTGSNLFWEDSSRYTGTWLEGCIAIGQGRAW
jgi:hypothetical protein